MKRWFPLIITAVLAAWTLGALRVPKDKSGTFAVNEFGRLPVVANGRFQPLDSLARNSLLQLREKQRLNLEPWKEWWENPKMLSAIEWLMEMTMNQQVADTRPVFRIDHPDLKGLLALPIEGNAAQQTDGKHFSWNQITPKMRELQEQLNRAAKIDQSKRNPFEQAVMRLGNGVGLYMRLQNTLQPQNARDWNAELDTYIASIEPGRTAAMAENENKPYDKAALEKLMQDLQRFNAMLGLEMPESPKLPLTIPPPDGSPNGNLQWDRTGAALIDIARGRPEPFAIRAYAKMSSSYVKGDVAGFNGALADYRSALTPAYQPQLRKVKNEQLFNFFEPFYRGMVICVLGGLLAISYWFVPATGDWLRRGAVWLATLTFGVLMTGLIYRMVLEGRPPVTNLYSSALFIGWGAIALGLVLELFWKNSIGVVISCVCGFICLIIAHHLALSGDTMEMMRAVLDTNFWLATHVVVVTLGYASTFVAGFLALVYILRGFFTTGLDGGTAKSIAKMVYGIICFATLFSFVGTVLGGIWADQSWGRFWGWDAKENGALIIVLWNALILHARWGGLVRERGLMNLTIFGNVVTAWSWFGVNMLGIGLHSYGFMDAAFKWLLLFVGFCLLLNTIAVLPLRYWLSFTSDAPAHAGVRRAAGWSAALLFGVQVVCVLRGSTTLNGAIFVVELVLWLVALLTAFVLLSIKSGPTALPKETPQPA
jgi:ABC-type transport system involved in cytochrome c biogenesis permease subunit